MKFIITPRAASSLEQITEFLKQRWTHKELSVFKNDIRKFKRTMNEKIIIHPNLEKFPNVKYTFIGKKQVKLFYEVKENTVVIKLFWHCRQNPENIQKLLDK